MTPAKGYDFSAGCETSDTLPPLQNSEYRLINTKDSLPEYRLIKSEDSLPEWSEIEALLQAKGLEKFELSVPAERGESQEKFEFAPPPVFEDFSAEQEHIDGYHQAAVCCDATVGDVDGVKQPPAHFSAAVEEHLHGRLPALRQSRYQQILAGEKESLDGHLPRADCSGFAAGPAAKALRQFCPRRHQEPEQSASSRSAAAPPAAAITPLMPRLPTTERLPGRGKRPGRKPSSADSSRSGYSSGGGDA